MTGPPPKKPATRQRRNRTSTATTLEAASVVRVALPDDRKWHTRTQAAWDIWWASPMVEEWVDADVPALLELAVLVDDFWTAGTLADRTRARAEIRMSSREFGLTPLSRRSLQWEVKRVQAAEREQPAPTRQRDPRLRAVS